LAACGFEPQQFPGRLEDIAPLAQVLWRNAVKTSKGEGGETLRRPWESRWMALAIQHVIRLQQQSKQVERTRTANEDQPGYAIFHQKGHQVLI